MMIMKKAAFSSKKTIAHPSVQNGGERERGQGLAMPRYPPHHPIG
jgi:hypothetical protein